MSDPTPLRAAYLIYGTDRPKVRRAVSRLRKRVEAESGSDLNITVFDAEVVAPQQVLEAAATPGFALGTRLLLVLNGHRWKVKQRQAMIGYLQDPMPDTCLAIEGETFTKDDALAKALAKAGEVLRFDLPKKYELAKWVAKRARAQGLRMNAAAAKRLLSVSGDAPERLEREIEKLAAYCHGGEARVEDVDAVCTPAVEVRIFDLMDAVGLRDRHRAFALLESVYAGGEDPNAVLFSLKRHVRLLDRATQLGVADQSTAAKQLGVHPFTARKLLEQREHYDRRSLNRAYGALAEAEVGMRGRAPVTLESSGGVNHGDRLVLELALGRILS
jgi:DNA polymerase-3 subunit delta